MTKHIIRLKWPDGKYCETIETGPSQGLEYYTSDMMYEERWLMEAPPRSQESSSPEQDDSISSPTSVFNLSQHRDYEGKEIGVHVTREQSEALWHPPHCQAPNDSQAEDCVDGRRKSADAMHGALYRFIHADVYQALENTTLSDTHDLPQSPAFQRLCLSMFERIVGLSFNENDSWTLVFHPQLKGIFNSSCLFLTLLLQAWDKAVRETHCVEYIADGEQYWIPCVVLREQRVIDLDLHPIIDIDAHPEFEGTILNIECMT
ncbi:hypothetical protein FMUND_4730 [Fusarium mundagurra]|uniref:Uncharacterized protein n=1 Tax=Fusarium mundagurra TaxID=1567541 RepID=A0A8H5YVD5_9HYPO|nr:hypothetical protein FMUND_4730 [Fusarium mundagurra]